MYKGYARNVFVMHTVNKKRRGGGTLESNPLAKLSRFAVEFLE